MFSRGLGGILESPYPFQFGFWLRDITGLPEWARQNTSAYELLADWLEREILPERIPEKALKAFRQIAGREPYWRKETNVKCDITFAVLEACVPVLGV